MIHLTGIAHAQTMYVEGDDPLDVNVESLALDAKDISEHAGLHHLCFAFVLQWMLFR